MWELFLWYLNFLLDECVNTFVCVLEEFDQKWSIQLSQIDNPNGISLIEK